MRFVARPSVLLSHLALICLEISVVVWCFNISFVSLANRSVRQPQMDHNEIKVGEEAPDWRVIVMKLHVQYSAVQYVGEWFQPRVPGNQ